MNNNEINIVKNIISSTNKDYINMEINRINNKFKLDLSYYENNKGLSIGSVCSQMFAIFYLNEMDHLIKENLVCKYYIRYMDDGIILMEDKERLRYIYSALKKEIKKYKLEFNNKTKIYNSREGFNFLGINYYIKNNKIIKRISKKNKRKIIAFIKII